MKGDGSGLVLVVSVRLNEVRERREIITTLIRMSSAVLRAIYLSSTLCLPYPSHHLFIPLSPSFRSHVLLRPALRSTSLGPRDSCGLCLTTTCFDVGGNSLDLLVRAGERASALRLSVCSLSFSSHLSSFHTCMAYPNLESSYDLSLLTEFTPYFCGYLSSAHEKVGARRREAGCRANREYNDVADRAWVIYECVSSMFVELSSMLGCCSLLNSKRHFRACSPTPISSLFFPILIFRSH